MAEKLVRNFCSPFSGFIKRGWQVISRSASILILGFLIPSLSFSQNCANTSVGFPPINDLGVGFWHGAQGGLYPNGQNVRPADHNAAGVDIANQVVPLSINGEPDPDLGKIVLLGVGMSNAYLEFGELQLVIDSLLTRNVHLRAINGALGGWDINRILDSTSDFWRYINRTLADSGLGDNQVQVVWFKEAEAQPSDTTFPAYPENLKAKFKQAMHILVGKFPNVKLCYLPSRIYAGYSTSPLNPEPFAYYQGWAVKGLIEDQINGDTSLVYTGPNPRSPWLSWGIYQWADGLVPRSDGLTWICPNDFALDGTHPSEPAGTWKVAHMLLDFFMTDETTRSWFLQQTTSAESEHPNPRDFHLSQNYPNPFNPSTAISYELSAAGLVSLKVFDILGREVATLVNEQKQAGTYSTTWDASHLSGGVYLYRLQAGDFTETKRLVLLK